MKTLSLLAFAALSITAAFAQKPEPMKMPKPPMPPRDMKMDPMMGLTPAERKVAMMHMKKMTPAEKAVMMKMHSMRMMGKSQKEAMAGLTKSEMVTATAMMKKMSPMEKKVGMKMMDHAQAMSKGPKKPMPMPMKKGMPMHKDPMHKGM